MERYINQINVVLVRGDGQCIDIGEAPNLISMIDVAKFLMKVNDAIGRCGYYDHYSFSWSIDKLDFSIDKGDETNANTKQEA